MEKIKAEVDKDGDLIVTRQTIYESRFFLDYRADWYERKKIKGIFFQNCCLISFPSAKILFMFLPNLNCLEISDSKLSRVKSMDLLGFGSLTELYLHNNEIEELPGDLFIHTPKLQRISFSNNKIKVIGEEILDPLKDLKYFSLNDNPGVNICYDKDSVPSNLVQFKEAIKRCKPVHHVWKIIDKQRKENDELKKMCDTLEKKVDGMKGDGDKQNERIENLEKKLKTQAGAFSKLDFTVKINGKEFKVQKKLLIDNSPLLAQMIEGNKGANTLEIKDISEATFEEILIFIHSKQPPNPTANLIDLYAASGCLQMRELMDICAAKLIDKVTPENAFEILWLCKKYQNIELQKKALAEYGKSLEN